MLNKKGQQPAIIAALITVVVIILVNVGAFNNPYFIKVLPYGSEYFCPEHLYFSMNKAVFELIFKNSGNKDSALTVKLDSRDVSFEKDKISYYVEARSQVPFKFKVLINKTKIPENITIDYTAVYKRWFSIVTLTDTCKYKFVVERIEGMNYELIK